MFANYNQPINQFFYKEQNVYVSHSCQEPDPDDWLSSKMRPRNTASTQAAAVNSRRVENYAKKDITYERADIAGFTLLFQVIVNICLTSY